MKLLVKICLPLALCALVLSFQWSQNPASTGLKSLLALTSSQTSFSAEEALLGQEPSRWLKTEAARMNQMDNDPEASQRQLEETAANLTEEQMQALGLTALNQEGSLNERLLAIYLLRLNKNAPSEIFEKIAMLEETSQGHHSQPAETALAFSALEEIELRSLADRQEIARLIRIGKQARNPKVASISPKLIQAAQTGKPFYLEAQK